MLLSRVLEFIRTDIWRIRLKELSRNKSFGIRLLRIILLATRGFSEGRIHLKASALTLYSLLGIVPVFAMAFGIARGFGFEKTLQKNLLERFHGQEEVVIKVIDFANTLLEATKGGVIAGIGLVVLIWAVIRVLRDVENALNDTWGIEETRSFGRKFSDYLTIIIVCPILLVMSGSVTVFINAQVTTITERVALLGYFSQFIFFMLKFLPYFVIWGLFTFIYILVPNTKVNFRSGLIAGVIAGSIYQIVQWGYVYFQVGVAKYNAIYGGFAALPLFLIWLQMSWIIVLIGAEISFAHQNVDTYEFEPDSEHLNLSFKRILSLLVAHRLTKHFSDGEKPLTSQQISRSLEIPVRLVRQILFELVHSGIMSEVKTFNEKETAYQPAFDINRLTIAHLLEAMDQRGVESIPVAQSSELGVFSEAMEGIREAVAQSPANRLIKDI